jgi:hypothetical protein
MGNTADRMRLWEDLLAVIDRRRSETGDPLLGSNIERLILDCQIQELERDIAQDPGAFEPWLVRRRAN